MRILPTSNAESERGGDATEEVALSRRVAAGTQGGLVATLVMTAYRLPVSRSLPPTALFWAEYVAGGESSDHPVAGLLLHLLYGVAGGALFGALLPSRESRDTAEREGFALVLATGYGLALSAFGERVVLERLLGLDPTADERLVFHVSHLVYGLTLGTWFGSRTGDER